MTTQPLRLLRADSHDVPAELARLRQPLAFDPIASQSSQQARTVRAIIRQVARRQDHALIELTERFDGVRLEPHQLRVSPDELATAACQLPPELLAAIDLAIRNVRRFQQHILMHQPLPLQADGVSLHSRLQPLRRVGICVPAAAAPLPSTAIMTAVPAQVAGVGQIALVAPPRHNRTIHPTILATAHRLGITEVYRLGGAQAVAALALGTQTIPRVDKIAGPGGIYTQLAKKFLFGQVDIDSLAGPTEILIIADQTARPAFLAADMLAQLEHDPGLAILLVTNTALADAVQHELANLLNRLPRAQAIRRCLQNYAAIVLADLDQAITIANHFAPEHLHIQTEDPSRLAERIDAAGAIFLGHYCPEAAGDYIAGPSHVLPTGGTARSFSGLTCNDFLRQTSILCYDQQALRQAANAVVTLANAEQLTAHALSVQIRCP
ncbi:MAG: histidinol dehydrogenase [Phycisphaerae bacterium]